jgi:hypothetical protein
MKKLFTSVVVVLTITWAVGLAAFVPTAQAVALNSGDLIKASLPAVYYYGADAKRYVFPDVKTYQTWYSNFSSVKTITDTELAMIPIGGNVTYRPGAKMLKINTDPKVYAVDKNGTLRWVKTEAIASCLYGSSWGTMVNDVSDAFFVNYTVGAEISDCSQYNKTTVMAASPDINTDKGLAGGAAGNITASLAADNPSGATLPKNATGVRVLKFNLSGTGTVTSLTFKTEGVGNAGDIAAAYLYEGNTRLTSGKSFNTSTKEATFNTNIAMSTHVLTLVVDVAGTATASDQHAFKLLAVNGEAIGGVMGNTFTIGAQAVSDVALAPATVPSNPKVGTQGAEIANFKITGGVNDAVINSIILTQVGSINSEDLKNFVLKQAGNTVATAAGISAGDKIVLVFSTPFSLLSGANKTFTLYADVMGRPGRTISVYLDEPSDLYVIDSLYGFGATVTNTLIAGTMAIANEGGVITIAYNGPTAGNVSKGAKDVVLFKFALTAAAPVDVKNTRIQLDETAGIGVLRGSGSNGICDAGDGTNYFTDIKLVDTDTGRTMAGPVSLNVAECATNSGLLLLTDDYTVNGTMNLAITADIANNEDLPGELAGGGYKVTLGAGGVIFIGGADVKYADSNDYVVATDIVPNTPIVGNQQTVMASNLTAAVSTYIGDNTHVKGSNDDASVAYVLSAGSDSDIRVRKMVFNPRIDNLVGAGGDGVYGNDENANVIVSLAKLWEITDSGWVLIAGPKSVAGTTGNETITFDNLNITIPAADSKVYAVSFNASTSAVNFDYNLVVSMMNTNNIEAYDKDDNAVAPTFILQPLQTYLNQPVVGGAEVMSTVTQNGSISLTPDLSNSLYRERLVQMNTTDNKALRVKARSNNEDFKITDARITVGAGSTAALANPVAVTINYPTNYNQTTFATSSAVIVNVGGTYVADFTNMNWYVPADVDSFADVSVNTNTSTNGAVSGIAADFWLNLEAADADINTVTKALGLASGLYAEINGTDTTPLTPPTDGDGSINNDATGNSLWARKTLLTVEGTGATNGTQGKGLNWWANFKVSNSSGNTAELYAIALNLAATDNAGSNWICALPANPQVMDSNNQTVDLVGGVASTAMCGGVSDSIIYNLTFASPVQISPNSNVILKVKFDTSAASSSSFVGIDTVRVEMLDDAWNTAPAAANFSWNDGTGTGVPTNNGYKVETLPESDTTWGF